MEQMYTVQSVAAIMDCGPDTARARMEEMPDVVNVGTKTRRILLVPESNIEDWFRNHRMTARMPVMVKMTKIRKGKDGKLARMDRRTGKLKAV